MGRSYPSLWTGEPRAAGSTWRHRQGHLGPRQQQTGPSYRGAANDSCDGLVWSPPHGGVSQKHQRWVSRDDSGAYMSS